MEKLWESYGKKRSRDTVDTDGETVEEMERYIPLPKNEALVADGGEGVLGVEL